MSGNEAFLPFVENLIPKTEPFNEIRHLAPFTDTLFREICFMSLPIMVSDSLCTVANAARFSQWMLAYTASIVNVAFLYVVLLTQQLGYIAISVLDRDIKFVA